MTKTCPTRFLNDLPAEKDAFGPHERVAQAIATLIREEDGGKTIALTGSWGSGKSTVVQILKNILTKQNNKNKPNELVFIYDAWAHQGDSLRRSFLEELINFFVCSDKEEKEKWEKELEKIIRRREETVTTSEPILTVPGKLMAVCALLLPLGYTLFSNSISDKIITICHVPIWILGLLLSLSPIMVALFTWIYWRPTYRLWTKRFWFEHRQPHQKDSVVSLFIHKTREINKSLTVRTPDPTSIEFRDIFVHILDDVLGKKLDRKLLIVIDNLYRVPTEEALSIWSTMRTFFDPDIQRNQSWTSNFWLLVPFDSGALKRLWGNEKDKTDEKEIRDDLAKAFEDKTFQITFHVSPPVLSDWKNFFVQQLSVAFPKHVDSDDFHIIYRLYSLKGISKEHPLAPRDIKLFINKVGVIHRQWGDTIPLTLQALYILCKDNIKMPEEDLIKSDFLEDRVISLIEEPEWQRYLAALHFNVEPEKAIQVLIQRPLLEAFSKGDSQQLQQLQSVPGFLEVCEHVIEDNYQEWSNKEPIALATTALSLSNIEVKTNLSWNRIWQLLQKGAQQVEQWKRLNENVGKGIVTLLKQCSASDYERVAQSILMSLSKTIQITEDKETPYANIEVVKQWLNGIIQVVKSVYDAGYQKLLKQSFRVPGEASFYVALMTEVREETVDDHLIEYLMPEAKPQEVVAELTKKCEAGQFVEKYSNVIKPMMKVHNDWPWQQLVTALNQRLQGNNNLNSQEIAGCAGAMLCLAYNNATSQVMNLLKQLSMHGHLAHHLHQAYAAKDFKSVSLCMFPIFEFIPEGNLSSHISNSSAGISHYGAILKNPESQPDVINNFAQLVLEYNKIQDLLAKADSKTTRNFVSAILEAITKREDSHEYLSSSILITNYSNLREMLHDNTLRNLINRLVEKGNLLSEIEKREFSAELAGLYLLAYEASKVHKQSSYIEFLLNGIRAVEKEDWIQGVTEEGDLLELLIFLVESNIAINLSTDFQDALLEHAKGLLEGQELSTKYQGKWNQVLGALKSESKETFLRDLRDELLRQSSKNSESILILYGQGLLESGILEEKADDAVRLLFREIINRGNVKELTWLHKALKQNQDILKKCKTPSKNDFISRVKDRLMEKDFSDEVRQQFEEIAKVVGVNPEEFIREESQ